VVEPANGARAHTQASAPAEPERPIISVEAMA
jgi:hypothetical protein